MPPIIPFDYLIYGKLFDRQSVGMTETLLKCTTRHIRLFTAKVEGNDLVPAPDHLTLDIDPDNEFIWTDELIQEVHKRFKDLVNTYSGKDLSDYNLRKIGSDLEGYIRELLQSGRLNYNPDSRVMNYSMGLPRKEDLL